jgi:flagellar biosynthesis protein FlhF
MIVKRYRGGSMREALELVKQELGEDAVILKSETVPRSSFFDITKKNEVEVLAAVDLPSPESSSPRKTQPQRTLGGSTGYFARKDDSQNQKNKRLDEEFEKLLNKQFNMPRAQADDYYETARDPVKNEKIKSENQRRNKENPGAGSSAGKNNMRIQVLMQEVKELRHVIDSLENRMGRTQKDYTLKEFADLPAPYAEEVISLMQKGVENRVARIVVEKAAGRVPVARVHQAGLLAQSMQSIISSMIKTAGPIKCSKGSSKVIVLAGPTGSGKTTTLAKLAANSKFVFNKKVALISADTQRVSALEHLNSFAGISQLPLSAVYSPDEIQSALSAHQDKDLIFVDTAGRSPKDDEHMRILKSYLDKSGDAEVHLVLPVTLNTLDLAEVLRRFKTLSVNRLVLTKLDETHALGNILNISVESDIPISYVTNGQTIPDDIQLANEAVLAQMIMEKNEYGYC